MALREHGSIIRKGRDMNRYEWNQTSNELPRMQQEGDGDDGGEIVHGGFSQVIFC